MTTLVDTNVWSLAFRRTPAQETPEVKALREALTTDVVVTIGIVLQELLQGNVPAAARQEIIDRVGGLQFVTPSPEDHVAAADLVNTCRSKGVQLGTIDALIAQVCIRHRFTLLTTDADFRHAARHSPLKVWTP